MKFSCLQENLKQGLLIVSHVAGKNVNLPILNNVLIEARAGDIKLVATDLEIGITTKVRGKVEAEGSLTVDAKITNDYVGLLPNQKVDIRQKETEIHIECENNKTKIKGQSSEEFPLIPKIEQKSSYLINSQDLKQALSQVLFAVSAAESRLELTGVLFHFQPGRLTLAATDSYRLAERTSSLKQHPAEEANYEKRIIVPAKTLSELARIIASSKDLETQAQEVKCYVADNQIMFSLGATELISRLIEGQYPNYQQIIPQNSKTKAVINRQELIRAVKAASLFAKAGINDISLDFPAQKNTVVVTAASGQTGEHVTELPAKVSGSDNGIVINYRYLLDGLNTILADEVRLEVVDSNTPCVLRAGEQAGYLYIIMPIKQ